MKICFSSTGETLDAPLDFRFARAVFFLIVDENCNLVKSIENTGVNAIHGAGPLAAQVLANEKVDVLITGNIGPNALGALRMAGIKVFASKGEMTVKEAFDEFQKGNLQEIAEVGRGFGQGFGFGGRGRGGGQGRRFGV